MAHTTAFVLTLEAIDLTLNLTLSRFIPIATGFAL